MIDHLGLSGRQRFLDIINCSWNKGQLSRDWRKANVIPIKKCGNTDSTPESFRPIALTSIACKIMEKMVLIRLTFPLHSTIFFRKNITVSERDIVLRISFSTSVKG
ncbi:hypothetical protein TNCV_4347351 [Trichonephila clavipes]|nr:hypothetical protein TNCV_4347351 [Trichonephila clavipes]